MEFGFLTQGYLPKAEQDADPNAEHNVLMDDFELCLAAEAAGFKYVWISEHHFLDEYSHLSASDVFLGALAHATSTIHIGSGIFNPLPKVHHPAARRREGRDARSPLRGPVRVRHRPRGGQPRGDRLPRPSCPTSRTTQAIWEETIGEFAKMWLQRRVRRASTASTGRCRRGRSSRSRTARLHPPMWYAAGNTTELRDGRSEGTRRARVLARRARQDREGDPRLQGGDRERRAGRRLRQRQPDRRQRRDVSSEDRDEARRMFTGARRTTTISSVYRYHDTFPRPAGIPAWPEVMPPLDETALDGMIELGSAIVGDPDDAIAQFRRWEADRRRPVPPRPRAEDQGGDARR